MLGGLGLLAVGAMSMGATLRSPVERCGPDLVPLATRCCGVGQREEGQRCVGPAQRCGGLRASEAGCVASEERVQVPGGRLRIGPSDWEAQGVVAVREISVAGFWLDRTEATEERLARCVAAHACRGPAPAPGDGARAVTLPVSEARSLCAWSGGRLPRDDEWTFAAMGTRARRYPWGDTGAVCRRAVFGLASGPCGQGATGPDTVGARPAGASPEGLLDLAGNVAEYTELPDGATRRRGGSFRTSEAAGLRGWNGDSADHEGATGVRCAYDRAVD